MASAENKCPLCGKDNACAMAAGRSAESCWCWGAELSQEALASIPGPARGKFCICAACGMPADRLRETDRREVNGGPGSNLQTTESGGKAVD